MWLVCLICAWPLLAYVFQLLSVQTRLIDSVIKKSAISGSSPTNIMATVPLIGSHVHDLEDARICTAW